jgi:purine-binding chemotaxis protein CheW
MTDTAAVAERTRRVEGDVDAGQEYVTFYLNEEVYAFEALRVQEIIEYSAVTKVPHLPDYLKGVINLRGTIIPVVDLKGKFGMASEGYKKHTCIIVTELSNGVMGLIVDAVSDILYLTKSNISDTPSFGAKVNTEFIKGMGKVSDNLVLVLAVDKILSGTETQEVTNAVSQAANVA